MKDNCKKTVWDDHWHTHQCTRKAQKDGFCNQHHPETIAARAKKSDAALLARNHVRNRMSAYFFVDDCTRKEDLEKLSSHIQTRLSELS